MALFLVDCDVDADDGGDAVIDDDGQGDFVYMHFCTSSRSVVWR